MSVGGGGGGAKPAPKLSPPGPEKIYKNRFKPQQKIFFRKKENEQRMVRKHT